MAATSRKLTLCLLVVATAGVTGCASLADVAGIPRSGHQPNGTYTLLDTERDLDCRRLANEIELGLSDMKKARSRIDAERETMPTTVVSLYGRMFGGPDGGLKNAETYKSAEVRVRTLNRQLAARNCHPLDVNARILAFDLAPMITAAQSSKETATTGSIQRPVSYDMGQELEELTDVVRTSVKR